MSYGPTEGQRDGQTDGQTLLTLLKRCEIASKDPSYLILSFPPRLRLVAILFTNEAGSEALPAGSKPLPALLCSLGQPGGAQNLLVGCQSRLGGPRSHL